MRFFGETHIDFVGKRKIAFIISATAMLLSIFFWIVNGMNYSVDFTGGLSLELDLTPQVEGLSPLQTQQVRDVLSQNGINDVEIQDIKSRDNSDLFLIRTKKAEGTGKQIVDVLRAAFPQYADHENVIRLQEEVGARVGDELKGKAIWAIFYSLIGIIIYVWWRFELVFGISSVLALFHDVLITVGFFALTGKEISIQIVAALLTIVGYSINDTIVMFDRVREDLKLYRRESYESIINRSINETLGRTINTSLTVFITVLALYLFGGSVIHDFAFAMMIGTVVGVYSSVYVACPMVIDYFNRKMAKKGIVRGK